MLFNSQNDRAYITSNLQQWVSMWRPELKVRARPFKPQGGCHTAELDAWNSAGHGGTAPKFVSVGGAKNSVIHKWQRDESRRALFGHWKSI